jgi:hypothetical protein
MDHVGSGKKSNLLIAYIGFLNAVRLNRAGIARLRLLRGGSHQSQEDEKIFS